MKQITLAVPACNEEAYIGAHLAALDRAAARTSAEVSVLVFANGCTDATVNIVGGVISENLDVRVAEAVLPAHAASAGIARREAARRALELWPATDVLVTSDADAEFEPDCLASLESGIRSGADLVCGAISFDLPHDVSMASPMMRHDQVAAPYGDLMRELRFGIDLLCGRQVPGPIPHYTASGACMALSRTLYDHLDGLPAVPCGEDRALVRSAEAIGARVRFCSAARATVSSRLMGRAAGGMADTLLRRLDDQDAECDAAFLSADEARRAWNTALAARGEGRVPLLRNAQRPMRVSELEQELQSLAKFIAAEVRPRAANHDRTAPMVISCGA